MHKILYLSDLKVPVIYIVILLRMDRPGYLRIPEEGIPAGSRSEGHMAQLLSGVGHKLRSQLKTWTQYNNGWGHNLLLRYTGPSEMT